MSRLSPRFSVFASSAACLGALLVAGCGGPSPSADATCADFGKMSEDDQKTTAQKVLEARGESTDGLAAGAKIAAARMSIKAFCAVSGDTAKVSNVTELGTAVEDIGKAVEESSSAGKDGNDKDAGKDNGSGSESGGNTGAGAGTGATGK